MTNQELIDKLYNNFEEYKTSLEKDTIHNYHYYGLAFRYEICEFFMQAMEDNPDGWQAQLDHLKTKDNPLEYLYEMWIDTDDTLWEDFSDTFKWKINNDIKREKE